MNSHSQAQSPPTQSWQPGFWHVPWPAIASIFLTLLCMAGAACIIGISNDQTVESWRISPTVLIAILSGVANLCLGVVVTQGIAITWWRNALHGTTLTSLNGVWNHGFGSGMTKILTWDARMWRVAFVTILTTVATLANNPLLQRAISTQNQDVTTSVTMMMDVPLEIPDGYVGVVDYNYPSNTVVYSTFVQAVQEWYFNDTIYANWDGMDRFCNGTCTGTVQRAGITMDCSSTNSSLDLANADNNGAFLFNVDFDRYLDASSNPVLLMSNTYVSEVAEGCIGTLSREICYIYAATVEYPVIIRNDTFTRDHNATESLVSKYSSAGDSPSAKAGAPAGPLAGLHWLGVKYFASNSTLGLTGSYDVESPQGLLATQFLDSFPGDYPVNQACNFQWFNPTNYISNAMDEVLFRFSILMDNGTSPQTFHAQQVVSKLLFHSEYRWMIGSLAIVFAALLSAISLLWGWWQLGRNTSLSPLETAHALSGSPIVSQMDPGMNVDGILSKFGDTKIVYEPTRMASPQVQINPAFWGPV